MNRHLTAIMLVASVVLLLGAVARAQYAVDPRLDLSTQPVYQPFGRTAQDYSSLYTFGLDNFRYGRSFMGKRDFITDRYMSNTITRFYRDTVGVQDVTGGQSSYGPGQPYYLPGSLVSRGSTVNQNNIYRSPDPFGLAPSGFATAQGFSSSVYYAREPTEVTEYASRPAQLPSSNVLYSRLEQMQAQSQLILVPPMGSLTQYNRVGVPSLLPPPDSREGLPLYLLPPGEQDLSEAGQAPGGPQPSPYVMNDVRPQTEGETAGDSPALRPFDVFFSEYLNPNQQTATTAPGEMQRMDLLRQQGMMMRDQAPEEGEAAAEGVPAAGVPGRPMRLDEQFYQLGMISLRAGAYNQAADAFSQVVQYAPTRRAEAEFAEGLSQLLAGSYYTSALLLARSLEAQPSQWPTPGPLWDAVTKGDTLKKRQAELESILAETPNSPAHAFDLAWILIAQGHGKEGLAHLKVAAKGDLYGKAIEILRTKAEAEKQ